MPIKRNHSPGNPRMSVANQLELSPEAEAELRRLDEDITIRRDASGKFNRVVAELTIWPASPEPRVGFGSAEVGRRSRSVFKR